MSIKTSIGNLEKVIFMGKYTKDFERHFATFCAHKIMWARLNFSLLYSWSQPFLLWEDLLLKLLLFPLWWWCWDSILLQSPYWPVAQYMPQLLGAGITGRCHHAWRCFVLSAPLLALDFSHHSPRQKSGSKAKLTLHISEV